MVVSHGESNRAIYGALRHAGSIFCVWRKGADRGVCRKQDVPAAAEIVLSAGPAHDGNRMRP